MDTESSDEEEEESSDDEEEQSWRNEEESSTDFLSPNSIARANAARLLPERFIDQMDSGELQEDEEDDDEGAEESSEESEILLNAESTKRWSARATFSQPGLSTGPLNRVGVEHRPVALQTAGSSEMSSRRSITPQPSASVPAKNHSFDFKNLAQQCQRPPSSPEAGTPKSPDVSGAGSASNRAVATAIAGRRTGLTLGAAAAQAQQARLLAKAAKRSLPPPPPSPQGF